MADDRALLLDQLPDSRIGEIHQREQRVAAEWYPFGRALHLDEPAIAGLHDVHVDLGARVVFVGEIEQRFVVDDADADRGDVVGERTIWIDCDVIQADGGTRTASITGAFVALALALEKMREREMIKTIPLSDYVAATSVGIVDGEPLLDLAYDDDSRADVDMNIVKTGDGRFIEVQGTAEAIPFGREALMTLLDLADHGIRQLIDKQRAIVGHLVKQRDMPANG